MTKLLWAFFCFGSCVLCGADGDQAVTESGTYERHETVGAQTFDYTARLDNGTMIKTWAIDGRLVDKTTYEQRLKDALGTCAAERNGQRLMWRDALAQRAHNTIARAELATLKDACIRELVQLESAYVSPYLAFKPETIASENSLQAVKTQLLPALDFVTEKGADSVSTELLKKLTDQIEDVYERLVQLYADTLDIACAQISDTKTLKKLLDCGD